MHQHVKILNTSSVIPASKPLSETAGDSFRMIKR